MIINEEDYLAHFGRKGMKWYQHIFGDKDTGSGKQSSSSSDSKRVSAAKQAAAKASKAERTKTKGYLTARKALGKIGGTALGGYAGMKVGIRVAREIAFRNGRTIVNDINNLNSITVTKHYLGYPTLGQAYRARNIGAVAGLGVAVGLSVLKGVHDYRSNKKKKS